MPAFLIADETIEDAATFEEYKKGVVQTLASYGGRFLSRGAAVEVIENGKDWRPGRMVILEFPSMAALKAWYADADYAALRELRFRSAKTTLVAMDQGTA